MLVLNVPGVESLTRNTHWDPWGLHSLSLSECGFLFYKQRVYGTYTGGRFVFSSLTFGIVMVVGQVGYTVCTEMNLG